MRVHPYTRTARAGGAPAPAAEDRLGPGRAAEEQTRRPSGTLVLLRNGHCQVDTAQLFAGLPNPYLTGVGLTDYVGRGAAALTTSLVICSPLARGTRNNASWVLILGWFAGW